MTVVVEHPGGKVSKESGDHSLLMRLYFCSAKHSLLQRGGAQMRGGAVTKRQAYSEISAASIFTFTKSNEI